MVECIFLSHSNFTYSYNLRQKCLTKDIYLELCRYIPEMLEKINKKTAAILFESTVENAKLSSNYFTPSIIKKIYLLNPNDNKIYTYNGDYVCNTQDKFLDLDIFNPDLYQERYPNAMERITNMFNELGMVVNKWQGIYLKELLYVMSKLEQVTVNEEIMKMVSARLEIPHKDLKELLEYYIRPYYLKINEKLNNKIEKYSTNKVIDGLFELIFN